MKNKPIKLWIMLFILMIPLLFIQGDDKELFMGLENTASLVKPNVIILMDTSEVMNAVIFYPRWGIDGKRNTADDGYDPRVSYTGLIDNFGAVGTRFWPNSANTWDARWIQNGNAKEYPNTSMGTNWTGCYADDGVVNGTKFQVGSNSAYFSIGERILYRGAASNDALATIKNKWKDPVTGNPWFELGDIVGGPIIANAAVTSTAYHFQRFPTSIARPVIVKLYGTIDYVNSTKAALYDRNYLKWLYIHATDSQRTAVSHFSTYATFDITQTPGVQNSACSSQSKTEIRYAFTRIQVAREVCCKVAEDSVSTVKLGLYRYDDSFGGDILDPLNDMSESASLLNAYKNTIYTKMDADGAAPMAEALADVWWYYRPKPGGATRTAVEYDTAVGNTNLFEYWCQNSYVVLVSSGESSYDLFESTGDTRWIDSMFEDWPIRRTDTWSEWKDGWGDNDLNESASGIPPGYDPAASFYCPNWTCWQRTQADGTDFLGSDYIDDVAYFMSHADLFPEQNYSGTELYSADTQFNGWPGVQRIFTYTIGFNSDSDLLYDTAVNGEGAYYSANSFEELVEAFRNVITSILLRNFAFSAITAPKKTSTVSDAEQQVSYVGYFMPSNASSLWEGHLLAFELIDKWGWDEDNSGSLEPAEFRYDDEDACLSASGSACTRLVKLAEDHMWDAAARIPETRNLFTHSGSTTLFAFNSTNKAAIWNGVDPTLTEEQIDQIITEITKPHLADVFHSDLAFVGPVLLGKTYLPNVNSPYDNVERFADFYEDHKDRDRLIYVGTNDGVLHMLKAEDTEYEDKRNAGKEIWGFLPDAILPSLKTIIIDKKHTYTTDGRLTAEDIYFSKSSGTDPTWSTVLCYGLRSGGKAFYAMDITDYSTTPTLLWKFKDSVYSAESWSKPIIGRLKIKNTSLALEYEDKWVAILTGGMAYNYEVTTDKKGKALFIVDAATGQLLWLIGYDSVNGDVIGTDNVLALKEDTVDGRRHYTKASTFNFPIPSAVSAIDKDYDGYLDSIYFGNTGGNLFKLDVRNMDPDQWTTTLLYSSPVVTKTGNSYIVSVVGDVITVKKNLADYYAAGRYIYGETSGARGYIRSLTDTYTLNITVYSGTFVANENLIVKQFDPIFLSPAVAYDNCYNIWVAFGTGDRDRPRTNPVPGCFVCFKDNGVTGHTKSSGTLTGLTVDFTNRTMDSGGNAITNGFYFYFSQSSYDSSKTNTKDKLFDPEPLILPDEDMIPHIYFNTYTPPLTTLDRGDDPCDVPLEGTMKLYDIMIYNCGVIEGENYDGRIAGGGAYQGGKEYVMYVGTPEVGSVPPLEKTSTKRMPYPGGIVFWREVKK